MLINQSDIVNARMTAFVDLGKTISKLFADFETASKSLTIWVPKKYTDNEVDEKRLTKMLARAHKDKTNEEAQRLLGLLLQQLDVEPLRVVKYSEEGGGSDDDSDSDAEMVEKPNPGSASDVTRPASGASPPPRRARTDDEEDLSGEEEITMKKVTFDVSKLLRQLDHMKALDRPSEQVLLPLSSESQEHLREVAREVRDRCEAAVELPDFETIAKGFELLSRIIERLREAEPGATDPRRATMVRDVKEATKIVIAQYVLAKDKVKARIEEQLKLRMERLGNALSETNLSSQLDQEALHAFSWARRCLGAAKQIETYVESLPTEESLQLRLELLLSGLCDQTIKLEVSDPAFKVTLIKLGQVCSYFQTDATDSIFAAVGKEAGEWRLTVLKALIEKMASLKEDVSNIISLGYRDVEAAIARSIAQHDDSLSRSAFVAEEADNAAAFHFDQAGEKLRIMREAQQRLSPLAPELTGVLESTCECILARLDAYLQCVIQAAAGATVQLSTPQLIELTTHLAALSKARSSFKLRIHFEPSETSATTGVEIMDASTLAADDSWVALPPLGTNALDMRYRNGIDCIVAWHARVLEPVLEDVKKAETYSSDADCVSRICAHRAALEVAKHLFLLGSNSRTGIEPKVAEAIQGATAGRQKDLEHKIHGELERYTKEAISEVQDLDNGRCSYADFRKKLTLLEAAAWWDALAQEATIGKALDAMWRAFHDREVRLVSGAESIESLLRSGRHEAAAAKFRKLSEMSPLWSIGGAGAEPNGKAHEAKDLFDTCVASIQQVLASKILAVQQNLLREGSWAASDPPRVDKAVLDNLKRADQFVDLTTHMEALGDCLQVGELLHAGSLCKSRVESEFRDMKARVEELANAIAKGSRERLESAWARAKDVYEVLRVLYSKAAYPALFQMLYEHVEGDFPDFVQIETAFYRSLKMASQNFPRLKLTDQSVLTQTLKEFEGVLPATDVMVAGLKKDFDTRHEAMAARHSDNIDKNKTDICNDFLKHTYTSSTYRKMQDLYRGPGEDSHEFAEACQELQGSLERLVKEMSTGILIFKLTATNHSEALGSFPLVERIVAPWNFLQAALITQHSTFLERFYSNMVEKEPGTVPPAPFVLKESLEQVVALMVASLKDSLEPLVSQFCQNHLETAAAGIQQIDMVIEHLRSAPELYEKARHLIDEVRNRQKAHLESLKSDSSTATDGKNLKAWLSNRAGLLRQLDALQRKGNMQAEYEATSDAVILQIRGDFKARLAPVLDGHLWRNMKKDELESAQSAVSAYQRILSDLPAATQDRAISEDELKEVNERIQVKRRSFVVVNFESKEPSEQASIISDHLAMPTEYSDFVERYRAGYKKVSEDAYQIMMSEPLKAWAPRELSRVMIRMRSYVQYDTFETAGPADLEPYHKCENKLLELHAQGSACLTAMIQALSVPGGDASSELTGYLKGYLELLRIAVNAIECSASNRSDQLAIRQVDDHVYCRGHDQVIIDFETARSHAHHAIVQATELFGLLLKELQTLQMHSMTPARCPADLNAMGTALRRLQRWEGKPGEDSMFDLIVQLEQLLPKKSVASASADSSSVSSEQTAADVIRLLATHATRVQNAGTVICIQLDKTKELLDAPRDPQNPVPLPKEPFELALSKQMDDLVNELSWKVDDVRSKRACLKSGVIEQVSDFNGEFIKLLQTQKYTLAGQALKGLKRFEFLMEMSEFRECRGRAADYNEEMKNHAKGLEVQAIAALPLARAPEDLAEHLIRLKKLEDGIPSSTSVAREAIKVLLVALQKKFPQGMVMLGACLKSIDPVLGNAIVNSSEIFAALRVTLFNARTQQAFGDVLTGLIGEPDMDKTVLERRYNEFKDTYDGDVKWALGGGCFGEEVNYCASKAKQRTQLSMTKQAGALLGFTPNALDSLPKVLAAICALWSVQFYLKTRDPTSSLADAAIRQPHAVQVLCILRLLGAVGKGGVHLENHLAEVPTGEGKSLVLAVTAATLALYDYHVDCVCYSNNLSSRDHDAFKDLFGALGLYDESSPRIRYGTFEQLSERLMTEKHGLIREQMLASLQGKKLAADKLAKPAIRRVLLIDEVDVFLDPSFFSGIYRPGLMMHDERAAALMRAIWANPSQNPLELAEYKALFTQQAIVAKGYEWFVESAAREMQRTAADFKKKPQIRGRDYELTNGWVWYKSQDSLVRSDQLSYSYMTNCVYLYEHERGSVEEAQLLEHGLPLHAICGEFSYALLPSTKPYSTAVPAFYDFILGVTGTLREDRLPPEARNLLRDQILIKHMTYCPSMYGALQRNFDSKSKDDVQVASNSGEHFIAINNEIVKRLKPTDHKYTGKRAVLVFFESIEELDRFYNSSYFARLKDGANLLTEVTAKEPEERDSLVSKATRQGQITLATRVFGRGVDFIVDDEHMVTCGGLHVLLTFFPRDVQEEVQIMGRSGRQGEKGSFSMVMNSLHLQDFGGDKAPADTIKTWVTNAELYQEMSKIRSARAADDLAERLDQAESAKEKHNVVATALHSYQRRHDSKQLCELLKSYNRIASSTTSRTLILIDVTRSMDSLIEKTKACIGEFFDRCQKVLDEEGIVSGFELQLAGFSNYNVRIEEILEASTWELKPHNLSLFLNSLHVRGGLGEEAIEVGLMHALSEHQKRPIDQIIIIGDAPANSLSDIDLKRGGDGKSYGRDYWDAQRPPWAPSGIPKRDAAGMLQEIQAVKPVPLHCYWMAGRAKDSFNAIAALTGGGTSQKLDVNSKEGAQLLTDAVCKQILTSLGGAALADAYERMKPSFSR